MKRFLVPALILVMWLAGCGSQTPAPTQVLTTARPTFTPIVIQLTPTATERPVQTPTAIATVDAVTCMHWFVAVFSDGGTMPLVPLGDTQITFTTEKNPFMKQGLLQLWTSGQLWRIDGDIELFTDNLIGADLKNPNNWKKVTTFTTTTPTAVQAFRLLGDSFTISALEPYPDGCPKAK